MKKLLLFAIVTTAMLSGCTRECDHDFAAIDTYYFTVRHANPNQWSSEAAPPNGDGPYFYATFNESAITDYVIESGVVLCYVIENGRDNILPYLRPWGFNNFNEPFFQNIRFDIERGKITFIIEASDMNFPFAPALDFEFKVVVIQNWTH